MSERLLVVDINKENNTKMIIIVTYGKSLSPNTK